MKIAGGWNSSPDKITGGRAFRGREVFMGNQDFLDSLRQTITETAEVVTKKTEDLVEIQKLRSRIRTAHRNMELDYKKIGEIVYQRFVGGETTDEELSQVCRQIMELQKETASCREELANRRGQTVCTACGSGNPKDAVFCMHCGAVMPKPEKEEDPYTAGPVKEETVEEETAEEEAREVWEACAEEEDGCEETSCEPCGEEAETAETAKTAAPAENDTAEKPAEKEETGAEANSAEEFRESAEKEETE